jgi:hypothetical protein
MRLVDKKTGNPIKTGDTVFVAGMPYTLVYMSKPIGPWHAGIVGVLQQDDLHRNIGKKAVCSREYSPSLIGAEWTDGPEQMDLFS